MITARHMQQGSPAAQPQARTTSLCCEISCYHPAVCIRFRVLNNTFLQTSYLARAHVLFASELDALPLAQVTTRAEPRSKSAQSACLKTPRPCGALPVAMPASAWRTA